MMLFVAYYFAFYDYPNIIGPNEMDLNDNVVFMFSADCPTFA